MEAGVRRLGNVPPPTPHLDLSGSDHLEEAVDAVVAVLVRGEVAVIPTDTVYGLICAPGFESAARAMFEMKRRPSDRRLPVIVADIEQARADLPLRWSAEAEALATAFWPGAMTIAFGTEESACDWLVGRDEVAVRAPAHPLVQGLARRAGPLLMTSANLHGAPTPESVRDVLTLLASPPALAVDGGRLTGAASTLVNTNLSRPEIEREGASPAADVEAVLRSAR
jgi:L-threonylcarbamoyladenylate synthase